MKKFIFIISLIVTQLSNSYCHSQYWEAATPFPGVSGGNRKVSCMDVYNNELIVGGDFTSIGGIVASGIARWNGLKWSNVGQANLFNSNVKDIIQYNNKLYFTADKLYVWDGIILQAVTYLNGNQQLNIDGQGDLHVFNGDLYIVGSSKLIKYNGVTASDITINSPVKGSPKCLDDFNNNLYLGTDEGLFRYQNNTWTDITGITNTPPNIIDIEKYNNELYVLGYFGSIGGITAYNFAKYDGNNWSLTSFPDNSSLNMNTQPGNITYNCGTNHLRVMNNELYFAHYFVGAQAQIARFSPVVKFNGTNWVQIALNPSVGGGGCSIIYNNHLYCGGQFGWLSDSNTDAVYNNKIGGIAKLNNTLGINDISIDKQNTYPNPTSSEVKITINQDQLGKSFKLFDHIGREKMSGVFNSTEYTLNLESFEAGIYFLKIADEDAQIKIVKN